MDKADYIPPTLMEAIKHYSDPAVCVAFIAKLRWDDGPVCPRCASKRSSFLSTRLMWKCLDCKKQFSVKVGSIFEDSPLGLDKWLCAMWLMCNCKNGVSSYEIARDLKITQKSAWFLLHRIRYAMQTGTFSKLSGQCEADESFIGGKARNMHADKRREKITGRGPEGKAIVMGVLARHGDGRASEMRATVVETRRKQPLQAHVREHVEAGSELFTDALKSYDGLNEFQHQVIDHAEAYVNGQVHTNGCENFWSLLKRGLNGTYVSVEPFHLFRYLDEQVYRFNKRKATDADRFVQLCAMVAGKRLTWKTLTGKNDVQ